MNWFFLKNLIFPFSLNFWMWIWFYPLSQTMPIPREYRDSFGVGGVKNQTAFLKFLSLTSWEKSYLFIFFHFSSSSSLESRAEMISKQRFHSTLDLTTFPTFCIGKRKFIFVNLSRLINIKIFLLYNFDCIEICFHSGFNNFSYILYRFSWGVYPHCLEKDAKVKRHD